MWVERYNASISKLVEDGELKESSDRLLLTSMNTSSLLLIAKRQCNTDTYKPVTPHLNSKETFIYLDLTNNAD